MGKLVQATLARGMVPPVVMEFPGITVGGGFAGSAGESSSFRYGYFDQTVRAVEVVLASGEVLSASRAENADLFRGAVGSAGTLGITTELVLDLIPARRYVRLAYHPHGSVSETIAALQEAIADPENDYVDGILLSETHGVVMAGRLTDDIPDPVAKPATFSGAWDPWFYLHAQAKPRDAASTDYVPLAEYLFRYDRGGFWVGAHAFRYFSVVPFTRLTRWFLNDFMHTRMLYRALHGSDMSSTIMIQDLALPYPSAERFVRWTAQELGIWPLWLCPLKGVPPPTFHPYTFGGPDGATPQPMLNIGLWGAASTDTKVFVEQSRALEAKLTELGGKKVLYSHTYYTEPEFWSLYDKSWYAALRARYSATSLPTVWDKVRVDLDGARARRRAAWGEWAWFGGAWLGGLAERWPFAGLVGVGSAIRSGDYLIHRRPCWTYWKDKTAAGARKEIEG